MSLTGRLRQSADYIWERIFQHPFVVELYTGTLPFEKFKYYVIQDYNYLVTMYKCFSLIASRAEYELARKMLELAYIEATTEMANYEKLLDRIGLKLEDVIKMEPAPTNTAYMNFLLTTCALGSPWEGLIAILPCFWSYAEIALRHKDKLERNPNRIYVEWASVYTTKEYLDLVRELREFIDRADIKEDYNKLERLFITASKYEYMFWDMAYKMEKWPI